MVTGRVCRLPSKRISTTGGAAAASGAAPDSRQASRIDAVEFGQDIRGSGRHPHHVPDDLYPGLLPDEFPLR
jgi:hypothetical protein